MFLAKDTAYRHRAQIMRQISVGGLDNNLINAKYRQKIDEFARRQRDLSRSEAEQQFLLYCQRASKQLNADPPKQFLRQVAWRWLTEGPKAAEQYAKT